MPDLDLRTLEPEDLEHIDWCLYTAVDDGNPAQHLYGRAGYATVSRADGDVVTIRRLD